MLLARPLRIGGRPRGAAEPQEASHAERTEVEVGERGAGAEDPEVGMIKGGAREEKVGEVLRVVATFRTGGGSGFAYTEAIGSQEKGVSVAAKTRKLTTDGTGERSFSRVGFWDGRGEVGALNRVGPGEKIVPEDSTNGGEGDGSVGGIGREAFFGKTVGDFISLNPTVGGDPLKVGGNAAGREGVDGGPSGCKGGSEESGGGEERSEREERESVKRRVEEKTQLAL